MDWLSLLILTYYKSEFRANAVLDEIMANDGECECTDLDLTQSDAVEDLVQHAANRHGRVASVIDAAGPHFDFNYIGNISKEQWHQVMQADLAGAFHLIQASVRQFQKPMGGNLIVVTTSAVEQFPVADAMSGAAKVV